jgi:hypothetical protein
MKYIYDYVISNSIFFEWYFGVGIFLKNQIFTADFYIEMKNNR